HRNRRTARAALHAGGRRFESCTAHSAVTHVGLAQPCLEATCDWCGTCDLVLSPVLASESASAGPRTLEPATASLQILLRGGAEGPRVVGGVETSRSLRASSSPLVVACRRDLTRI